MGTIYRKTGKGAAEIETRALKLAPRFRSLLILVDGRRSDDELTRLMPQAGSGALEALVQAGLIEAIGVTAAPGAAERRAAPSAVHGGSAPPVASFESRRRDAARALGELIGPLGDTVAVRIERSVDTEELAHWVEVGAKTIANTRGRQTAADFVRRFGKAEPPSPGESG